MITETTRDNAIQRKGKPSLIYTAIRDGEVVAIGTAVALAELFMVTPHTIGNCERTGRKVHGEYEIERLSQNGGIEWQK